MKKNNRIITKSTTQDSFFLDVAYVCIPQDVEKDDFIKRCLLNGVVCIKNETGLFEKDVFIGKNLLNDVVFPDSPYELGSAVLFTRLSFHSVPVVISILPSKVGFTGHSALNQIVLNRRNEKTNSYVNFTGWGDSGVLNISSSNMINITTTGTNNTSLVNLYSSGSFKSMSGLSTENIFSTFFNISNVKDGELFENFKIEREKIDIRTPSAFLSIKNSEGVVIKADSVTLGDQSMLESGLKGETLVGELNSVLQNFSSLIDNLVSFCSVQATASAGSPTTSHLAVAFVNLSSSVNLIKTQIEQIRLQMSEKVLSKNVKNS